MTDAGLWCVPLLVSGTLLASPQDARAPARASSAAAWTSWRGPLGTGVAPTADPPVEWSENKNVRWKVPVPGLGSSTPIVQGDRIYLTTAVKTDREGEKVEGASENAPTIVHEFFVLAVNRRDGSAAWSTKVADAVPHEEGHPTTSFATISPIVDSGFVYASFGSRGIYCLDQRFGKVRWSVDLGLMQTKLDYGEGSSPVIHGNTMVLKWDQEESSFLVALDKRDGKELWRTARDESSSWATPLVAPVAGGMQVVTSATGASRGYDFETGEHLWTLTGNTTNTIPSPMFDKGLAYVMSGYRGYNLQAIRLEGARGDSDATENVVWTYRRNTSYVASGLIHDDVIYFLRSLNGILTCLDARTGEVHYQGQRLGLRQVYSSPVAAAGRLYVTSRDGATKVIKLGTEYEEIATNQLDDVFDASAAIVGDELFLRGWQHLYCIARN